MASRRYLDKPQREKFAEKIMDWGNLVFAGLVIAQIIPGTPPFRIGVFILGIVIVISAYIAAYVIMITGGKK